MLRGLEKVSDAENQTGSEREIPISYITWEGGVISFLKKNPKLGYTPGQIAAALGVKVQQLYMPLSRLVANGKVARMNKGIYQFRAMTQLPLPTPDEPLLFHNLLLTQKGEDGGSPNNVLTVDDVKWRAPMIDDREQTVIWETFLEGDGWLVKVSKAPPQVCVASSKNPLTLEVLERLLDAVRCRYKFDLYSPTWFIRRIELNRDFSALRLDGCSALTVTDGLGNIRRFYNKPDIGLRMESTAKAVSMVSLRDAVSFLKGEGKLGEIAALRRDVAHMREETREARRETKYLAKAARRLLDEFQGENVKDMVRAEIKKQKEILK